MKKAIVVFTVIFCSYVCCAQQILRLNQEEIKANETPQAVAYNFVKSIIFEDYANAVELMSLDYFFELMPTLFVEQVPIDRLFSSEYTHKIVDMRPVVNLGYEVAITETQLNFSMKIQNIEPSPLILFLFVVQMIRDIYMMESTENMIQM